MQSGQIERSIILRVLDDNEPELTEYFTVELTNPTGGALLADTAVSNQLQIVTGPAKATNIYTNFTCSDIGIFLGLCL